MAKSSWERLSSPWFPCVCAPSHSLGGSSSSLSLLAARRCSLTAAAAVGSRSWGAALHSDGPAWAVPLLRDNTRTHAASTRTHARKHTVPISPHLIWFEPRGTLLRYNDKSSEQCGEYGIYKEYFIWCLSQEALLRPVMACNWVHLLKYCTSLRDFTLVFPFSAIHTYIFEYLFVLFTPLHNLIYLITLVPSFSVGM